MSHDDLCKLLLKAVPVISWISLGEAVTLTTEIMGSCRDYRDNPGEDQCRRLVDLAQRAGDFLRHRQSPNAAETVRLLDDALTQLYLEGPLE